MAKYLYLIHPFRHGFFDSPTRDEEAIMEEHTTYLKNAAETGIVLLAGPCLDDSIGLVVFCAENDQAANSFMLDDPLVKKNIAVAELHPMRISILGK